MEVVPYGGLLSWKLPVRGDTSVPNLGGFYRGAREVRVGAGVGVLVPLRTSALVVTMGADRSTIGAETGTRLHAGIGVTFALSSKLALHVSAGVKSYDFPGFVVDRVEPGGWRVQRNFGGKATNVQWIGSSQELGLASLPLVRVGPFDGFTLSLYGGGEQYKLVWWRLGIAREF